MTGSGQAVPRNRLVVLTGQEAAGKSTLVRALLPRLPSGAQIDAEDVGPVNPWRYDDAFRALHYRNVADLARNFWAAGYRDVLAASFVDNRQQLRDFLGVLGRSFDARPERLFVVQLCAVREARDQRRVARPKPPSAELRDQVDRAAPEDTTLADHPDQYTYLRLDTDAVGVGQAVESVRRMLGMDRGRFLDRFHRAP